MPNYTERLIHDDLLNIIDILGDMTTIRTKLAITGTIAASTTFTTNASGTSYTKTGDSVYLGANSTEFNANNKIHIYLNGVLQDRGVDAIFVSTYGFNLAVAVDNTDTILVIKTA
jgi:hypothetical protein